MKPFKRIMLALFVPPILGAALLQVYLWGYALLGHGTFLSPLSEQLAGFLLLICYGFLFCCIPGFAYWAILEVAWKYAGPRFKRKMPFRLLGAGLGTLCGAAIGVTLQNLGVLGPVFGLVGLVVGYSTSVLIYRYHGQPLETSKGGLSPG